MAYKLQIFFAFGLILTACSNQENSTSKYENIYGRDDGSSKHKEFIYRAKIPDSWLRQDPNFSNYDTKLPICEFFIKDDIHITIHNFPLTEIPPAAQIARWKNQFEYLSPESVTITPQSFSGYAGILFEGTGIFKGKNQTVMAWALQLAPQHVRQLQDQTQQRADVTIKALGDSNLMQMHRLEIINFARSFELIREIPSSL